MLQKAKTHAIPLGNHVTQQKLTETTENRSALTKTKFWHFQVHSGIFRFIWVSFRLIPAVSFRLVSVYSGTILVHFVSFRCHSASFRHIPVYSGIFCSIPFCSVLVFSNALSTCIKVFALVSERWCTINCTNVYLFRIFCFTFEESHFFNSSVSCF